jgi:hypothetical protein
MITIEKNSNKFTFIRCFVFIFIKFFEVSSNDFQTFFSHIFLLIIIMSLIFVVNKMVYSFKYIIIIIILFFFFMRLFQIFLYTHTNNAHIYVLLNGIYLHISNLIHFLSTFSCINNKILFIFIIQLELR